MLGTGQGEAGVHAATQVAARCLAVVGLIAAFAGR
jgi:hypothetical protein